MKRGINSAKENVKNGSNSSLFLFIFFLVQHRFYRKNVYSYGSQTQIVGLEGKHTDHLTTTTANSAILYFLWSILLVMNIPVFINYNSRVAQTRNFQYNSRVAQTRNFQYNSRVELNDHTYKNKINYVNEKLVVCRLCHHVKAVK